MILTIIFTIAYILISLSSIDFSSGFNLYLVIGLYIPIAATFFHFTKDIESIIRKNFKENPNKELMSDVVISPVKALGYFQKVNHKKVREELVRFESLRVFLTANKDELEDKALWDFENIVNNNFNDVLSSYLDLPIDERKSPVIKYGRNKSPLSSLEAQLVSMNNHLNTLYDEVILGKAQRMGVNESYLRDKYNTKDILED